MRANWLVAAGCATGLAAWGAGIGSVEHAEIVRQAEAALRGVEIQMDEILREVEGADPSAARRLRGALGYLRSSDSGEPVARKLQSALEALRAGASGTAREAEALVVSDLERILEILAGRSEDPRAALHAAAAEMKKILGVQKEIGKEGKPGPDGKPAEPGPDAAGRQERLGKRTEDVASRVQEVAGRLPKDPAEKVREAGRRSLAASDAMKKAAGRMRGGKGGEAGPLQEGAEEDLRIAIDIIEEVEEELPPLPGEEKLLDLEALLRKARGEEERIRRETAALDGRRAGLAERILRGEASGLSLAQGSLSEEVRRVEADLEQEGAVAYAGLLREGIDRMDAAGKRLSRSATDGKTQRAEREAEEVLTILIDALANLRKRRNPPPPPLFPGPPGPPGPRPKPKLVPDAAQIRMLRIMEARLSARVESVEESRAAAGREDDGEILEEIARLSGEQRRIGALARRVAESIEERQNAVEEELR